MKTDWRVGDTAYVWYPCTQANVRKLKGSIVLVELLEQRPNTWRVVIRLSGFSTTWAKQGMVIYVTPDELYSDLGALQVNLEDAYRTYLMDQIRYINNHGKEQYDSR